MTRVHVAAGKNTSIVMVLSYCRNIILVVGLFTFAQPGLTGSLNAQVTISEEEAVSKMIKLYTGTNFKTPMVRGWRIQIVTTNDRKTMESALNKFESLYPDIDYKWEHNPPYYQVRIGAYERKSELEAFMIRLKEDFPSSIPVQDDIEKKEIIRYR